MRLHSPLLLFVLLWISLAESGISAAATPASTNEFIIGYSTQGRKITAIRIGDGPRKLVLVGNTHGGAEANTYVLSNMLAEHFRTNPHEVPDLVSLYIIPTLNPDGLSRNWRFNARGVDLNRNMNTNLDECTENNWRTRVYGAYGIISDTGGAYAESEVESRIIRDFLLDASAAIFYHSAAGLVFPAFCEHPPSNILAEEYAAAAGYRYERFWDAYIISGGMHDWASSLGIAAITPELLTGFEPEFEQNLAGVRHVLANAAELAPVLEDREEQGILVPALIWRYWLMHGGYQRFGPPLAPAEQSGPLVRQVFERAVLEHHPHLADTPQLVQPAPLGTARLYEAGYEAQEPISCDQSPPSCVLFPATGHTLRASFLDYWERADGQKLFGNPISEEFDGWTIDGQWRTMQLFERATLVYDPEENDIRLEPLGYSTLMLEQLREASTLHRIR